MPIEGVLRDQQERVDALMKTGKRYVSTLAAWKKACENGDMANRSKAAQQAVDLAGQLQGPAREAADSWDFDVRGWLESEEWRQELMAACREAGLRVLEEEETLVVPPVVVRAQPGFNRLLIGKERWPSLNPGVTAAHLKKLSEKPSSVAASQRFLEELYAGCKKYRPTDLSIRFGELYDHWSGAPGWKKENPRALFAQQVYTLQQSGVRTTRDQKTFGIEGPSGNYVKRDVFELIGEDGSLKRYYSIYFR